ncbi:lymphocyte antigen 6G-like isoform X1 [Mastacembelus armatus]|uniref:lymphocyte antigen 6G-like isoform X1 n=1 Tax=Mastacembelus armatus TaxID=205130 RepID=UPI000E462976|nr:lymphocyte antigen 6G-like isoform X1 [Mastacembelus armatus]
MMQLYRALILFMVLGTACGLRCYTCVAAGSTSCTTIITCPDTINRCFSMKLDGVNLVAKGCQSSLTCSPDMNCCEGDLCNSDIPTGSSAISTGSSAIPTGSSVFLLLVSSAITSLFL